ncbi:MAG: phosphorylase [Rhodoplanes sp.]|jgi:adenosylhomocysteine nucleosidase
MIVVVGLAFEARIAAGPGVRVICSGDGRNLVSSLAKAIKEARLRKKDCGGLISFGVAGGLDPELQPGTCVVGSTILCGETRTATDPVWSQRLLRKIPEAVHGPLMGVSAPVARPEDKRVLYEQTGAVAVDMESHIVASLARKHDIPMAAIRVITDPAERALPACAVSAMRPNGTTDILAMIRSVMARPRELPALLQTALDARAARSMLMRGRKLLGPGLGLPDFRAAELAPQ